MQQRGWVPTISANSSAQPPTQENQCNSVTEGNDRSTSPFAYNVFEADPGVEANSSNSESSYSNADFWCVTQMNLSKFTYVWTINNFSCFQEESGELKSLTFGSDTKDKLRFCLRINPRGLDDESREYLSLYLLLVQSNKSDIRAKFKFSILNSEKEESRAMESQRFYRFVQGKDWGFKKFIRRDFLLDETNGLLFEDKLTLFCEVSIITDSVNLTGRNCAVQLRNPPNSSKTLAEDIGSMFGDEQFSDFVIKVDGAEIKTHKCILAARSPVFKAMFSHYGLTENKNDSVEITDIDEKTIRGMLYFVYAGYVPELNTIAFQLLSAADKYEIKQLKLLCEHSLCGSLTIQNVCEIFIHADLHTAEQLKAHCIWFINQNSADVMQTEGYKLLSRDLVDDLYKAVMGNQKSPTAVQAVPARKKVRFH